MPRASIRRWAGHFLALAAVVCAAQGCAARASTPPPKPRAPDPAEEIVAALTQSLQLDAAQQQRTRELMKAMADRNDAIQARWARGARVDPTAIFASRGQFESELYAILTPEQKRVYSQNKTRMMIQSKLGGHP